MGNPTANRSPSGDRSDGLRSRLGVWVAAAAAGGPRAKRALARHPRYAEIAPYLEWSIAHRDASRSLRRFMIHELIHLEAEAEGRDPTISDGSEVSAAEYYLRRRRLNRIRTLRCAAARLPRVWTVIGALPAKDVVVRSLEIGVDGLALAIRGIARDRLAVLLAPLGRELALSVIERGRTLKEPPRPKFEGAVRGAFEAASGERERSRLAAFLGRRMIATLHRGLAPSLREEFARICRSNLAQKLASTSPLPVDAAELAFIETTVRRHVLSGFEAGVDAESSP